MTHEADYITSPDELLGQDSATVLGMLGGGLIDHYDDHLAAADDLSMMPDYGDQYYDEIDPIA